MKSVRVAVIQAAPVVFEVERTLAKLRDLIVFGVAPAHRVDGPANEESDPRRSGT